MSKKGEKPGPYISKETWEWNYIGKNWRILSTSQINKIIKQNLTSEEQYQRQWNWIWEQDFFLDFDKALTWNLRSEFENTEGKYWFKRMNLSEDEIKFKEKYDMNRIQAIRKEQEKLNFFHYILLTCWVTPQLKAIGLELDPTNAKRGALMFELKNWDIETPLERTIPKNIPSIEKTAKKWVKFLINKKNNSETEKQRREQNKQLRNVPQPRQEEKEDEDICSEGGVHEWEYFPTMQEKVCQKCAERENFDPMQYVSQTKYAVGGTKEGELSTIEKLTELTGWTPEDNYKKKEIMKDVILTLFRGRNVPNMNVCIENTLEELATLLEEVGKKRGSNLMLIWSMVFAKNIEKMWRNIDTEPVLKYLLNPNFIFWENPSGEDLEKFEEIQKIREKNPIWLNKVESYLYPDFPSSTVDIPSILNLNDENWVQEGVLSQYYELEIILRDKKVHLDNSNKEKAALIYIIMNKINGDTKYTKKVISKLFNVPEQMKVDVYLNVLTQNDRNRIKLIYPF